MRLIQIQSRLVQFRSRRDQKKRLTADCFRRTSKSIRDVIKIKKQETLAYDQLLIEFYNDIHSLITIPQSNGGKNVCELTSILPCITGIYILPNTEI